MERIRHFIKIFLIHFIFIVAQLDSAASHSSPDILNLQQFQRNYPTEDPRRLSPSEQAQILSDVQQHRPKFRIQALGDASPPEFTSLAKYKVDRAKQQEDQRQLEQQKLTRQNERNFFDAAASRFQPGITANRNDAYRTDQQRFRFQQSTSDQFANVLQPNDPSDIIFDDSRNAQLRNYFEKQRQLEILQLQRERLLAEQREIRRQQELLRLEQLRQLDTTTTTPTLTPTPKTTTYSPLLFSSPSARSITPDESNLFLKAIANYQKKFSTTTRTPVSATQPPARVNTRDASSVVEAQESQNNEQLVASSKSGPRIQIIYQTDKPPASAAPNLKSPPIRNAAERDALIKQLKLALAQSPIDDGARNISTRDIVLPNGKTIQLVKAPNGLPSAVSGSTPSPPPPSTTVKPPKAIIDELTKGVLPPGADFEVLRHKVDGNVEEIDKVPLPNVPNGKKVTFVVLEEQSDGSYKVQGVRGNDNDQPDVASIVQRIKTGELKLPPSSRTVPSSDGLATTPLAVTTPRFVPTPNAVSANLETTSATASTNFSTSPSPSRYLSTSFPRSSQDFNPFVTVSSVGVTSTTSIDRFVTAAATPSNHILDSLAVTARPAHSTTLIPNLSSVTTRPTYVTTSKYFPTVRSQFVPTMAPVNEIVTRYQATDQPTTIGYSTAHPKSVPRYITKASHAPTPRSIAAANSNVLYEDKSEQSTTIAPSRETSTGAQKSEDLVDILRGQSLYAMAKFLRQSRLDSVLNETGPYTIFVPTDKAFRTLLVQLGGPEKAEEKFQENPRLLSGLLLHHVVPGAFRIDSLQDEMTGVSLAGTQLRVNVYSMQDIEWNDVKLTTINGARVSAEKRDIKIPQGIAHAIDRVMFPLPVGDLVQTLQADRERRFTTFLRALHASGLEDSFSDSKTFTIFAPTNSAFAAPATVEDQAWLANEENREAARALVSRHVVPSTLFTVGMRYYQQKDTLSPETPLHIYKNGGRVKVNNGHVITHNIPATNGVIHAVDVLL